jgi:hypothetical protein
MYPTFYDLVVDLFGVSIPAFKFMKSYGIRGPVNQIVCGLTTTPIRCLT